MSERAKLEEERVQEAIRLLNVNPGWKIPRAAKEARAIERRVRDRIKGIPPSNTRGGHNKKLGEVEDDALKGHIEMCKAMGRAANEEHILASANSILRCNGARDEEGLLVTVSKRWVKRWIKRNQEWLIKIKEKPLSAKRHESHKKEDIDGHFKEFKRCKTKWGILDEDTYNFDETGCQIGINAGGFVIVPKGSENIYVDDPENRELVTSTECFSAVGYHVPSMLTFKGAYHLRKYFENDLDGDTYFTRSESGFVNDKLTMKWLCHFDKFTKNRTKGKYRLLIFDGYGSHETQDFLDYCWDAHIRPYKLPAHSTHFLQPADVGAFQTFKKNLKAIVREEVFLGATTMTKTDFFAQFQRVTDRTWTKKLCRSAFRKTGLIPLDPEVVYKAMRKKGYHFQEEIPALAPEESLSDESEPAFATPPARPILWHEFDTPITNTTRKRGIEYLNNRDNQAVTPTARRVRQKCNKAADTMILKGQLAQELLMARKAHEAVQKERNKPGGNKVVQKYGEIYGKQARRQIILDIHAEEQVVNMHDRRLRKPFRDQWKQLAREWRFYYCDLRTEGRFPILSSLEDLGLLDGAVE